MDRKAYWEKYGDAVNLFERLDDWNETQGVFK